MASVCGQGLGEGPHEFRKRIDPATRSWKFHSPMGLSNLLTSLGHTGRERVVLRHTLNTLQHDIAKSQCFK